MTNPGTVSTRASEAASALGFERGRPGSFFTTRCVVCVRAWLCMRAWLCVVGFGLALHGNAAADEATNPERERARSAFAAGKRLLEEEQSAEAERHFRAALEYKETAGLHYYVALSLEKQGRWVEALGEYRAAEQWARTQRAEDVARLLPEALLRLDALLPRVSVVGLPEGARLFVEGRLVAAEGLRLDPGPHALRIEAPGYVTRREHIVLAVGERREVAGALERERVAPQPTPAAVPESTESTPISSAKPIVFWSGAGLGALGLGVGVTALLLREGAAQEVEESGRALDGQGVGAGGCRGATGAVGDECARLAEAVARRDDAAGWIGAGFAAAGVGVATAALTHWLWEDEEVRVAPNVAWDSAGRLDAGGVSLSGNF